MKRKKEMTKFPLENKDNTDNQTDKVKTELIRKKYLYRRLIQTKPVNIPLKAAVDLIGTDCAYHLYTGSNINKHTKKQKQPPNSILKIRGLSGWENCENKIITGKSGSVASDMYSFMVSFLLYDHNLKKIYNPEYIDTEWKLSENGIPVSTVNWAKDKLNVSIITFSVLKKNNLLTFTRVNINNSGFKEKDISLFVIIKNNPLTDIKLKSIRYIGRRYIDVNNKHSLYLKEIPGVKKDYRFLEETENFILLNQDNTEIKNGSGSIVYNIKINPGKNFNFDFYIPSENISLKEITGLIFDQELEFVKKYWNNRVPIKITVPDKRYTDCFYASIYYQLIMMHNYMLCPGPKEYKKFFLHDAVDMVNSLSCAGLFKVARKSLGYFNYKGGDDYYDGLGGNIFVFYEHYRFTKDKKFLKQKYPLIIEKCRLIKKLRSKQLGSSFKNTPSYGLMPESLSQDNWKYPSHLYVDNWWTLIGLKSAIETAQILNKKNNLKWIREEYNDLKKCLYASFKKVMAREKTDYIPGFADFIPFEKRKIDHEYRILGHTQMAWAHRPALYPGISMGMKIPFDLFKKSYKEYWKKAGKFSGYDGGWYVEYEKFFWGYNVKLAQPMMYLGMGDVTLKNIEWSLANQSCPCGWMEAMPTRVNKKGYRVINKKGGIVGDIPHGWSAAHYIILLRNMLFREENSKLLLLPCIPAGWYKKGKFIEIKNAPTYFGELNFNLQIHIGHFELTVDMKTPPPDGYKLTLPLNIKIRSVTVNKREWKRYSENIVILPAAAKKIKIDW